MGDNKLSEVEIQNILDQIPQKPPFRFLDDITEMTDDHVVGHYHFKEDEYFYKGHFPDNPITPGVILVEAMAQAGLVALGIHLMANQGEAGEIITFFTDCDVEFSQVVLPGSTVTIRAEKIFWRKNKLKTKVELTLENGEIAASGTISGIGVKK